MVKPLELSDFRAIRYVLEADDYAIPGEYVQPTDMIEPEIWHGIVDLPDDIAVMVSDHHGTKLKLLHSLWVDWIKAVGLPPDVDNLFHCMGSAADCFQCATFSFLHGYYRSALADLRSALELVTIGAYGNLKPDDAAFLRWRTGDSTLDFPSSLRRLRKLLLATPLAWFLKQNAWPAKLYSELSHSDPGASDGALWKSNGPVYNSRAVQITFEKALCIYAACYVLVKVGRPAFELPPDSRILFELDWLPGRDEVTRAHDQLFTQ
jgi:hypothetical protein